MCPTLPEVTVPCARLNIARDHETFYGDKRPEASCNDHFKLR